MTNETNDIPFSFRISEDVCDKLDVLAKSNGLTRSAVVRLILIRYLEQPNTDVHELLIKG